MTSTRISQSVIYVLFLISGLAVGAGGVYVLVHQPQITEYEDQIVDLTLESANLNTDIEELQHESSLLESQIAALEAEKSDCETRISDLESELDEVNETISTYETIIIDLTSQISTLQRQASNYSIRLSSLEMRLNDVLEITVTQHYDWVYLSVGWLYSDQLDVEIPLSLYDDYLHRPRPIERKDWVEMIKDKGDDQCITRIAQRILSDAMARGFTETQKAEFAVAFVNSLPNTPENVTIMRDEYPRYPIETLFDRGGDCEDTSILAAAILDKMGFDTALLYMPSEDHVAVGVSVKGVQGSYYPSDRTKYYYIETTGEGWELGIIPPGFEDTSAYVYPLNP